MAFVSIPGLPGKVYVPDAAPDRPRKHDCRDCFACQHCGDDRCGLCRSLDGRRCPPPRACAEGDACDRRKRA